MVNGTRAHLARQGTPPDPDETATRKGLNAPSAHDQRSFRAGVVRADEGVTAVAAADEAGLWGVAVVVARSAAQCGRDGALLGGPPQPAYVEHSGTALLGRIRVTAVRLVN